jgi:GNAT superfamily N-acetyltransferase
VTQAPEIAVLDVSDDATLALVPPCADARFDHRSCDYWENDVRGAKASRPHWWEQAPATPVEEKPTRAGDNPFARTPSGADDFNPFSTASIDGSGDESFNPFAETPPARRSTGRGGPRKLALLNRGEGIFGSYAKVLTVDGEAAAFAQFGPLSAYPRAQHIRELYPKLPQTPLPAVITCIATTSAARGRGLGPHLVAAVCDDLANRGFAAIEAYPDLTLGAAEASSADPRDREGCGFSVVADDDRYPVLRRKLD